MSKVFKYINSLFLNVRLKGERFIVHRNLLIALMIAQISLIVATTGASNKVTIKKIYF